MCTQRLERLREASAEDRARLEGAHRERLAAMDARMRAVRERERRLGALEKLQAASAQKCARLQADIQGIKAQKVRVAPLSPGPYVDLGSVCGAATMPTIK